MTAGSDSGALNRHRVTVTENESLAVVHHEAPTDRWLFLSHGLLSDKSGSYEGRAARAVQAGYNAVRFDFRGCGDSDGAFVDQSLSARIEDLQSVVDFFDPGAYALFGSSFGGKVGFHVASEDPRVEAIGVRAPVTYERAFDDYRTTVDREGHIDFETGHRLDQQFIEDFFSYDFEQTAAAIDVPVAIFHGASDKTVPIADSFEAAKSLETDVLLEKFAGEGHRFSESAEERLRHRLFEWLAALPSEDRLQ